MTARSLAKGSNLPIDVPAVHADLSWTPAPGVPELTAAALLLTADGQARDAGDLILRHRPPHRSGAVLHRGRTDTSVERIEADLHALDARDTDVHRVLLLATTDGDATFAKVPDLTLLISDARTGLPLARFTIDAGRETTLIAGELYRHNGRWKFRAVAQGWANGLTGLATAYGFTLPTGTGTGMEAAGGRGPSEVQVGTEPGREPGLRPELADGPGLAAGQVPGSASEVSGPERVRAVGPGAVPGSGATGGLTVPREAAVPLSGPASKVESGPAVGGPERVRAVGPGPVSEPTGATGGLTVPRPAAGPVPGSASEVG
ncbi:TerD family protein, partial [Kitasatospora sp. NPDC092948]|uniref:TerD family protein n=1 Tax=Kitasatospora sp. NPDC092948 TaxID=3364088 RepID=UPI00382BF8EA